MKTHALAGEWRPFIPVKIWHMFQRRLQGAMRLIFPPGVPSRPALHLSDHLARDMGMSAQELELHRLRLPSQDPRQP